MNLQRKQEKWRCCKTDLHSWTLHGDCRIWEQSAIGHLLAWILDYVFMSGTLPTFPSYFVPLLHSQNKSQMIGRDQCIDWNLWLSLSLQRKDTKMAGREISQWIRQVNNFQFKEQMCVCLFLLWFKWREFFWYPGCNCMLKIVLILFNITHIIYKFMHPCDCTHPLAIDFAFTRLD